MTGIILMIIGILLFFVGVIIYNSSRKQNGQKNSRTEINKQKNIKPKLDKQKDDRNELSVQKSNGNKLDKIVEMAIADGVLTDNERKIIKKIAIENEQDYNEIIKNAERKLSKSKAESETELIDHRKKKGDDFEKFIVQKFNKKFFRIKEWAGDKYVKGIYADTTPQPDLLLEFNLKQKTYYFSVECKWRQNLYKGGIEFAKKDQFNRYKNFEKNNRTPVFLTIGIGGKAVSPEKLFIVPLQSIESNFIHIKELNKYERKVEDNFYYDIKTKELK